MEDEKIILNGSFISLSESKDDYSRKEAKFLICPLDESNLNGTGIKEEDISNDEIQTLVGQPLVTKVVFNEKTKEYDFSGHLRKNVYKIDKDGNIIKFSDFTSTSPIGYHTSIEIQDIDIGGVSKRCLVATVTLWTRYYHAMEVIERLGTSLKTSWEISYKESYMEDGIKWIKSLLFLANCVLGTTISPAFQTAGLLEEVAEIEVEDELAIAMLNDINELSSQSDENSVNDKLKNNKGGNVEMTKENENIEVSSLTTEDLYNKVGKAIRVANNDRWYYVSRIYPLEYRAVAHDYDGLDEDYIEFTYSVSENSEVAITGQNAVKMVFISKDSNEVVMAELEDKIKLSEETIATKEIELSAKVDEIVKLGEAIKTHEETIAEKDKAIAELEPLKAIAEAEAKVKEEAEIAEKKQSLSNILVSSKYFTDEEVAKSEVIQEAIAELSETKIKNILADKVVEVASKVEKTIEVEVSEVKAPEVSTDIKGQEYNYSPTGNKISDWLKNNKK